MMLAVPGDGIGLAAPQARPDQAVFVCTPVLTRAFLLPNYRTFPTALMAAGGRVAWPGRCAKNAHLTVSVFFRVV